MKREIITTMLLFILSYCVIGQVKKIRPLQIEVMPSEDTSPSKERIYYYSWSLYHNGHTANGEDDFKLDRKPTRKEIMQRIYQ